MHNSVLTLITLVLAQSVLGQNLPGIINAAAANNTFDYIIVGGGTAGLTVATRLSEDASKTVAVIEAGGDYDEVKGVTIPDAPVLVNLPGGDLLFCGSSPISTYPDIDWNFQTVPQDGANGRRVHYARGRCLGGSSARNFMIYQRGTKGSYERWAELTGDNSWGWDSLLPYFKKSVTFTPPKDDLRGVNTRYGIDGFSSSGGPLKVSYPNTPEDLAKWVERGLNYIGLKNATGFNEGVLDGVSYAATTIDPNGGFRSSSRQSFLRSAEKRTNLVVLTATLAKQIIFTDAKRAIGVTVGPTLLGIGGGLSLQTLYANKEVIVSAGAFQSPQLLMTSGVGPSDQLAKFNIPIVSNLSGVGQAMEDHIFFTPSYPVKSKPLSTDSNAINTITRVANDPVYLAEQLALFATNQTGAFTNNGGDYLGWEKLNTSLLNSIGAQTLNSYPADWPHIEYINAPGYIGDFSDLLLIQPKLPIGQQYGSLLGTLVMPQSKGTVTIASTDTSIAPKIDPRWLTDPVDQKVAIQVYKRIRAAFASPAMAPVLSGPEVFPGNKVTTDEQILDTIRSTLMTVWHASCTCKMGMDGNPDAVLDSQLRVRGVTGLRVVDASSFPILPPGHPQSSIYALAERASDLIKSANP